MIRIIIDTNILVTALKSDKGAAYALISKLPSKKFQLSISVPLYTEYQDVLTRKEHLTGTNTKKEILNFLRYLCKIANRQKIFFLWRPWLKDPKDDMVLELAVASKSQYIITYNYLEEEAAKGQRKDFEKVLKAVPHIEPEPFDQL
jgi:putative PIN family toxin of toxin-antitoxin system